MGAFMREALSVEFLKLRRSPVAWTAGLLMVILIPAICFGLVSVVEGAGEGLLAEKVRVLVSGTGWAAFSGLLDQFVASALFVGVGIVVIWCFGREFSDRTVGSLFALPTSRGMIAAAKLIVMASWSTLVSTMVVVVAIGLGLAGDLGPLDAAALEEMGAVLALGLLTSLLASTLALLASVGRGYLPAIGAMALLLMTAQMAVLFEAGAWYPFAAPGLWAVSGNQGELLVTLPQLALAPVLALIGAGLTIRWWQNFELV
jgi:ABC-2 type transport system permease protein